MLGAKVVQFHHLPQSLLIFASVSKSKKKKTKVPEPRGPIFLAFETATAASSVALYEKDRLLGSVDYRHGKTHARLITVLAGRLLEDLEIDRKELSGVFVAKGPGSYTGLRVGVSATKGLAMALDIPIMSAGSLDALAWTVRDIAQQLDATIVPMIDARRMEVYTATFSPDARPLEPPRALIVEEGAYSDLFASGKKAIFIGDGAEKCRSMLEAQGGMVLGSRLSTASCIGPLIWEKFQAKDFEDLVTFEPFYLKDFVATVSKKNILT